MVLIDKMLYGNDQAVRLQFLIERSARPSKSFVETSQGGICNGKAPQIAERLRSGFEYIAQILVFGLQPVVLRQDFAAVPSAQVRAGTPQTAFRRSLRLPGCFQLFRGFFRFAFALNIVRFTSESSSTSTFSSA